MGAGTAYPPGVPGRRLLASTAKPARRRDAERASADYGRDAEPDWREIDWPAHTHRLEIDGGPVNYVDLGERGDELPVVFVHGLGGCWQNWLENLPAVAERRRAIALDLPGFGGSEMTAGDVSITNLAATVEQLCEHLETGPAAVVGNSMGGFVAAELAIRHPPRAERLVLVDAAGISTTDLFRTPARTLARFVVAAAQSSGAPENALPRRPGTRQLAFGAIMRHPTLLPKDLLAEQAASGFGKPGFLISFDALMSYDFRDRLPEIACPTLIVQGTEDMLVPVRDAHEFRRLIPDSRELILEDTGHVPMLERPAVFNEHLLTFLDEQPGERSPAADVTHEPVTG